MPSIIFPRYRSSWFEVYPQSPEAAGGYSSDNVRAEPCSGKGDGVWTYPTAHLPGERLLSRDQGKLEDPPCIAPEDRPFVVLGKPQVTDDPPLFGEDPVTIARGRGARVRPE